jgi:hypothetical protein
VHIAHFAIAHYIGLEVETSGDGFRSDGEERSAAKAGLRSRTNFQ